MKILTSFEQGSPEWKQARAGKVTASRAKDARDKLKSGADSGKQIAYACQVALERVSGQPADATFENWQMREGHVQEPIARAAYERRTGNLVDEVGAFATDDDLFLYSPDGLIDGDGLLEVKTLFSPERIMTIVGNGDVSDFIDQCMFGLWLTGRQWIDLVVWVPSLEHLTIKRIDRDEDYIEAMETDLMAFSRLVTQHENTLRAAIRSTNEPALEAERERIRAEEAARADREARAKLEAEQQAVLIVEPKSTMAEECARPTENAANVPLIRGEVGAVNAGLRIVSYCCEKGEHQGLVGKGCDDCAEVSAGYQAAMFATKVRTGTPTLRIGTIKERLQHMSVTAEDLRALGFEPAGRERAAPLYHDDDFPAICEAIAAQALAAKAQFLRDLAVVAA